MALFLAGKKHMCIRATIFDFTACGGLCESTIEYNALRAT